MSVLKQSAGLLMIAMLGGCTSNWDLQGQDPKDYYAEHPKVNKVESRHSLLTLHFAGSSTKLSASEKDKVDELLHDIRPEAIDAVEVQTGSQGFSELTLERKEYVSHLLHRSGVSTRVISFGENSALVRSDISLAVTYLAVVLPDCPDWKRSPVTTYSNTQQANFQCATTVNLGLMVADPHDLIKGRSDVGPETATTTKAIYDYRSGAAATTAAPAAGASSGATSTAQ